MAITKTISHKGETREISFSGDAGTEFEMYVKQGTNYYNWDTDSFQTTEKILKFQKIPTNNIYTKNIVIPTVTSDTSYDFFVRVYPGSTLGVSITNEQKIGVLYQKSPKTLTFNTTSAASLVIQDSGSAGTDLTGGTITEAGEKAALTQSGTITKSGSPLIYVHSTPTWNQQDGGNWTNTSFIESELAESSTGVYAHLVEDGGDDIATGYTISGERIIDQITVSAISGDLVTMSAAQGLDVGNILSFSAGGWKTKSIVATMTNSGTTAVTMKMIASVDATGISNITSVCAVDSFVSVKPNAFPVSGVTCPQGGEIAIDVVGRCTNYLGGRGDNDANVATKSYLIHSVPSADVTASRPIETDEGTSYVTLDVAGTSSVSAGASMGVTGAGVVTYTPHATMIAGDKDYFYYKTADAQSTPVASSTTQ